MSQQPPTPQQPRVPTRRDAVANRERILDTAEVYFRAQGLDAPLHGLAKAAGVGTGTLYRNFASHDALVAALYARYRERFDQIARTAVSEDTGWAGIESVVRQCVELQLSNPIVVEVMRRQSMNDPEYRPSPRWYGDLDRVVARAIAEGTARTELTSADVTVATLLLGAFRSIAPAHREWVSERTSVLLLDGMRAHPHPGTALPPTPEIFLECGGSLVKRPT